MTPTQNQKLQEPTKPKSDRPIIVRQPDDSLIVFGPDVDDINLCDDPC